MQRVIQLECKLIPTNLNESDPIIESRPEYAKILHRTYSSRAFFIYANLDSLLDTFGRVVAVGPKGRVNSSRKFAISARSSTFSSHSFHFLSLNPLASYLRDWCFSMPYSFKHVPGLSRARPVPARPIQDERHRFEPNQQEPQNCGDRALHGMGPKGSGPLFMNFPSSDPSAPTLTFATTSSQK